MLLDRCYIVEASLYDRGEFSIDLSPSPVHQGGSRHTEEGGKPLDIGVYLSAVRIHPIDEIPIGIDSTLEFRSACELRQRVRLRPSACGHNPYLSEGIGYVILPYWRVVLRHSVLLKHQDPRLIGSLRKCHLLFVVIGKSGGGHLNDLGRGRTNALHLALLIFGLLLAHLSPYAKGKSLPSV